MKNITLIAMENSANHGLGKNLAWSWNLSSKSN